MKKFVKFILVLGLLLLPCFSSATNVDSLINYIKNETITVNGGSSYWLITNATSSSYWTYCVQFDSISNNSILYAFTNNLNNPTSKPAQYLWIYNDRPAWTTVCLYFNLANLYFYNENSSSITIKYKLYKLTDLLDSSLPVMSSLDCQTNYNLIPISEVTSNYCKLNFDLISPSECPSGGGCSGSGESIVFSNVYVNNVLYPGGADIYLNVNELLATEISYNSQLMYIDVDYDWDQDYINGIIDINTYQPTSNDFTQIFVGGLVRLFPYIVIALFIAFVRKLIRKIFK